MLQNVDGRTVFVVDVPDKLLVPNFHSLDIPLLAPYAEAFNQAIKQGLVTKPSKYAIEIDFSNNRWNIFAVQE